MAKRKYSPEQIINKLRAVELDIAQGNTVEESCRKAAINPQTYYRWRSRYGGMNVNEAKEYKRLQKENTRLKKVVADLTLDNQILKEAASKNF
jgi:transposase-like protein